jgi:hypothetical protein
MTTTVEDGELFRSAVHAALSRLSSAAEVRRAPGQVPGFMRPLW